MEMMNPNNLKGHPRNAEFFDDMDGQKWKDFLQSVRTSGIIEPIIVTQDLVIVSGHQRVRAAKVIGLMKVAVEIRHYDNEDKVLKDLIETNIMQRGIGNTNPIKLAKCIVELERIEGIRNGGDRKSDLHNDNLKTQSNLAEELKISQSQLSRYKKLLALVPELQDAVETGKVSATNASAILAKLPESEQKAIAEQILNSEGKTSKREIEFYKKRVQELSAENEELQNRKPEVVEVEVEVESPEMKNRLKEAENKARAYKQDYEREKQAVTNQRNENLKLQDEIERLKSATKEGLDSTNLSENVFYFCTVCNNFIGNVGGLVWLTERISDMPVNEREMFLKAARSFRDWAAVFSQNLERSMNVNGDSEINAGVPVLADKKERREN